MNLKNNSSILYFLIFSVILYGGHKLLFHFLGTDVDVSQFTYSLEILYAFFTGMGLLILLMGIFVTKDYPDFVGMAFLVATNVNLLFCYIMARPILAKTGGNVKFEKINFFAIFMLFLLVEMFFTAKMLKNTRKTGGNSKIE